MEIHEREPGDVAELERRAAAERDALRRDRYRAVLMAIAGDEAAAIADALGRARRSVQAWAYAYRDGGADAVQPKPRGGGRPTRLPRGREAGRPGWRPGSTPARGRRTGSARSAAGTSPGSWRPSSGSATRWPGRTPPCTGLGTRA